MKLSKKEIGIIQAVHWERENGYPHSPGNPIPNKLIDAGYIVIDQEGPFIPVAIQWKLLELGIILKPAKK